MLDRGGQARVKGKPREGEGKAGRRGNGDKTHLALSSERRLERHLAYATRCALGDKSCRTGFFAVFGVGEGFLLDVLDERM